MSTDKKGTLGVEIYIKCDTLDEIIVHTSCSEPIYLGMILDGIILGIADGESRNSGTLCPKEISEACGCGKRKRRRRGDTTSTTSLTTTTPAPIETNDCGCACDGEITNLSLINMGNYNSCYIRTKCGDIFNFDGLNNGKYFFFF